MSVYVVTWNLNREGSNYSQARKAFIDHLERYENIKDSSLESVRWINSSATASQIYDDLKSKLDGNDSVFISKVTANAYYGQLNKLVWEWIAARIS